LYKQSTTHKTKKELPQALEKTYQEEKVWEQLGCLPDFMKFSICFRRALILQEMKQYNDALDWAMKARPLAKLVNKNAEEEAMVLAAELLPICGRHEESIMTRNKLLASNKDYWNDSKVL
jgi:tetratricopeptide (TPR) repeat protein